jgi:hypothetical protein
MDLSQELQILEKHWERVSLPLAALSKKDKKLVKGCTPEGCQSQVYNDLVCKAADALFTQKPKANSDWEEIFGHSILQQFKSIYTPEELARMNIDLGRLLQIELILALRKKEFKLKEIFLLKQATRALDRSSERRLLDAIKNAPYTPKASLQTVESIVREEDVDLNSQYRLWPFLAEAAGLPGNTGLPIAEFLLNNGADAEGPCDFFGVWTPLQRAIWCGNLEIVRLLLARGVNVNAENGNGQTPMRIAISHENIEDAITIEIVRLLLTHGANVNVRDRDGQTPMDMAQLRGTPEIIALLIYHGAETDDGAAPDPQTDVDSPIFDVTKRKIGRYDDAEQERIRNYIEEVQAPSA